MTPAPRAVLYLRLSSITEDSTSIARQRRDLEALAAREGWTIVETLVDEGVSGRTARENAAKAVHMIREDEADVIACWKLDRWSRQGVGGFANLLSALDARKAAGRPATFWTLQDGLTSDSPTFRMIAMLLAEVARTEAENTAARVASSIKYRREVTHKVASGSAPFGYRSVPAPDGVGRVLELDPYDAPIVREVADRLASGIEPVGVIARDLYNRGVPSGRSKARLARLKGKPWEDEDRGNWSLTAIRRIWTSEALLGRQRHDGDVVRGPDGLPLTVWPPLIDARTLESIRRRFRMDNTTAATTHEPRRRASRVLSGVAFCGLCGRKMYVMVGKGRKPGYRCSSASNTAKACGGVRVSADDLDSVVTEAFLSVAGEWPELEEVTVLSDTELKLAEVERAIRDTTEAMMKDSADVAALVSRLDGLKSTRADLRAAPRTAGVEARPTGRTLAEAWASAASDAERRALLLMGIDSVEVRPSDRPGGRPQAAKRSVIRWRS